MKFASLLLSVCAIALIARENPFAPVESVTLRNEPLPQPAPEFDKEIIQIIKSVTCEVIEKPQPKPEPKKVWAKPAIQKVEKPAIKKPEPIISKPKIIHKKVKKVKKHHRKIHQKARYKTIYHDQNLRIRVKGPFVKVVTCDRLVSHFTLQNPSRLVLDFGDDFVIYPSISKKVHTRYVKRLKIGTHPCFYRVTLELKKSKRHKVKRLPDGYLITLF